MRKKRYGIVVLIIVSFLGICHLFNLTYSKPLVLSPLNANQIDTCNAFHQIDKNKSTVKILVIDGGGVNGIMPLVVLKYLEKKTGKPTSDLFDFFTGTSTGSIIVTTLNVPNASGFPVYSADEILAFYRDFSTKILRPSIFREIFTIHGLYAPILSIDVLYNGFKKILGNNITFGSLIKPVAITAYNLGDKKLNIFNSWACDKSITRHILPDIIAAAVATPTVFSPVIFTDYHKTKTSLFVDGMVFANNPSLAAIQNAFNLYPNAKRFIIVHLGTGGNSVDYLELPNEGGYGWGVLRWVKPFATLLYKSQNVIIREAINSIQHFSGKTTFNYFYFSKNLAVSAPFNVSGRNIRIVERTSKKLVAEQKQALDTVAQLLLAE